MLRVEASGIVGCSMVSVRNRGDPEHTKKKRVTNPVDESEEASVQHGSDVTCNQICPPHTCTGRVNTHPNNRYPTDLEKWRTSHFDLMLKVNPIQ
jgi:hypothetical protein